MQQEKRTFIIHILERFIFLQNTASVSRLISYELGGMRCMVLTIEVATTLCCLPWFNFRSVTDDRIYNQTNYCIALDKEQTNLMSIAKMQKAMRRLGNVKKFHKVQRRDLYDYITF